MFVRLEETLQEAQTKYEIDLQAEIEAEVQVLMAGWEGEWEAEQLRNRYGLSASPRTADIQRARECSAVTASAGRTRIGHEAYSGRSARTGSADDYDREEESVVRSDEDRDGSEYDSDERDGEDVYGHSDTSGDRRVYGEDTYEDSEQERSFEVHGHGAEPEPRSNASFSEDEATRNERSTCGISRCVRGFIALRVPAASVLIGVMPSDFTRLS